MDSYLTHRAEWAVLDHDKPGLESALSARSAAFAPVLRGTARSEREARTVADMPAEATRALGAPASVEIAFAPLAEGLLVTLQLRGKPANRLPEAGFFAFLPDGPGEWRFCKTGLWLPAASVATRGGGQLQAAFAAAARLPDGRGLEIVPYDAALVAPAGTDFMTFSSQVPDFGHGIRFNLYNNKWGTNFPMWWEGNLQSRFVLRTT